MIRVTDRVRNEANKQEGWEYPTKTYRRKTNWTDHDLRRNCLLKRVVEGKFEDTGRRGRRRKQLLINIKERVDTGN